MPPLNVVSGKKLKKILELCHFTLDRINGSHHNMESPDKIFVITVPIHGNEDLPKWLIKKIIDQANLSIEDYERLRKEL